MREIKIEDKENEYWYSRQYREVTILLSMKKLDVIEANHVVRIDSFFILNPYSDRFFFTLEFCEVNLKGT